MTRTHVITGGFGAGKTTAIRWLMARKPLEELWVVVLNEFTDAGLDALSVAGSARGTYEVRLVAGGCLCCIGEQDFGRQLGDILQNLRPARLLIEPSGAGHSSEIVDQLARHEAAGRLTLDSVTCLIDPLDLARLTPATIEWGQVQSADVLLLSKADLADERARAAFMDLAAAQYPAKAHVGECTHGELPSAALRRFARAPAFTLLGDAAHESAAAPISTAFAIGGFSGVESRCTRLGLHAVSWILPAEIAFERAALQPRLEWVLEAHATLLRRFKAVFRTGPGPSWAVQSHGRGLHLEESAYRRDSRAEIVLNAAPTPQWLDSWRALLREAVRT